MPPGKRVSRWALLGLGSVVCLVVVASAWAGHMPLGSALVDVPSVDRILAPGTGEGWQNWLGAAGGVALGLGTATVWSRSRRRTLALRQEVDRLQRQLQEQRTRAEQLTQEQQILIETQATLERTWEEARQHDRQDLDRANQNISTLQSDLRSAQADLQAHRDRLQQLQQTHTRDLQGIEADVAQTWDENATLRQTITELQDYIQDLELEVSQLHTNLEQVWRHQDGIPPATDSGAVSAPHTDDLDNPEEAETAEVQASTDQAFANVATAVAAAAEDYPDILCIWDSAIAAAAHVPHFGRPDEVYRALAAIAATGRRYFAALDANTPMGSWREAFREFGLEYKPTEHQITRTMYGSDRDFKHQGRKQRMLKHVTLGRKNTVHTLQIYFEVNPETRKIDIGYCGKHLRCHTRTS